MLANFDQMRDLLRQRSRAPRVAVVCSQDEHTLQAIKRAQDDALIDPILIGDAGKTLEIASEIGLGIRPESVVDVPDKSAAAQMAADMARAGEAQAIMKGAIETAQLMKVLVNADKGIRGGSTMSCLGVFESPYYHKVFGITDVGLLIRPTLEQKEAATLNAVRAFHSLGVSCPKVAVLAAIEKVNPKMGETVDARAIRDAGLEGCTVEGPISYDLAMSTEAARIKHFDSPVAGDADILVVPDIVSGNIAAKTITTIGGGRVCGVVLGAKVPIILVSRSATAEDKYFSIILSALVGDGAGEA